MDRPDLDRERHEDALRGLARVNALSSSDAIVWRPIAALAARRRLQQLTLLDLGSGGGEVAIGVARRAARAGLQLKVCGYDMSPLAVDRARAAASAAGVEAEFVLRDVFREPPDRPFDVVTCSLFLHHFEAGEVVTLLRRMREAAARLVVVNDLLRSRVGYLAAHAVCRVVTRSDVVHYDGPQSVAAAFRLDEIRTLADEAGLMGARLERVWPFRFRLTWEAAS
jgi:2-polyprenyl-3-methyl-5-hydroxy-6-metoxy-1,4-benzoquinol methylase